VAKEAVDQLTFLADKPTEKFAPEQRRPTIESWRTGPTTPSACQMLQGKCPRNAILYQSWYWSPEMSQGVTGKSHERRHDSTERLEGLQQWEGWDDVKFDILWMTSPENTQHCTCQGC
jgi:hypothetical protein